MPHAVSFTDIEGSNFNRQLSRHRFQSHRRPEDPIYQNQQQLQQHHRILARENSNESHNIATSNTSSQLMLPTSSSNMSRHSVSHGQLQGKSYNYVSV